MKEATENEKYIKNECWLNSIYDFYHDSLLRTTRRRAWSQERSSYKC